MMISKTMSPPTRLADIIEALEFESDEYSSYLDLETRQVETVSHSILNRTEEPDLPEWQKPEWEIAKRIASGGRFLDLPTKFDVNEWEIMQDFSTSVESSSIREDLQQSIRGAGAFRRFKDTVRRREVEAAWFAF